MIWLVVLGLAVWCGRQQSQLGSLKAQLLDLTEQLARLTAARRQAPETAPEAEAPLQGEALTPEPWEPVVVPELAVPPEPEWAAPDVHPEIAPGLEPEPSEPPPPPLSISDWLSENGLAWIGGGALALGGLMLVAYAAQRGLFTPAMRLGATALLGLGALGLGEALRRGWTAKGEPNRLVAALTTAAGAAMLYASVWAAYLLYHFIPAGAAASLLTAISFGLLGLALLHGEALGILAILAIYAVPVVSGGADWAGPALDGLILLTLTTGMAVAGLRRWGEAGATTLVGAGIWGLVRGVAPDPAGLALVALAAPILTLGAVLLSARRSPGPDPEARRGGMLDLCLPGSVAGAALLALLLWTLSQADARPWAALATSALILTVALAGRIRRLGPEWLAAPVLVLVLGALRLSMGEGLEAGHPEQALWLLPCLMLIAPAAYDGALRGADARRSAVIGAAGLALALTLAAPALARAMPGLDAAIDAAFVLPLAAAAIMLARRSAAARESLVVAAFIGGAAEVTGLALHASVDGRAAPAAYALLSLVLAALAVRVKWRGFAESAAVAALASLAALLAHPVAGAALSGQIPWLALAAAVAAASLIQGAAWFTLRTRLEAVASAEALSCSAILSALLGAFLVLQVWGQPLGAPPRLDSFTEASLRTLLLLAAGLMLAIRGSVSPWGRARAPVLLGLGAAHGLLLQGIILHPWWGLARAVSGPPLVDGLFLGLLAPALLLGFAARGLAGRARVMFAPVAAAALVFLLLWVVSEVRRLFHGPLLLMGSLGYSETAAYAVSLLGVALALETARSRLAAMASTAGLVGSVLDVITWSGLGLSAWLLSYTASPWWGPLMEPFHAPALLGLLYALALGLSAAMAWIGRRSGRGALAQAALIAAGVELFVLLTLAVRFAFHGVAMRASLAEASLETWTFSAVWALYGLVALAAGAGRRDLSLRGLGLAVLLGTTAKVFLFDLARLDGPIRAASFLALGAVLLAGALAARRFGSDRRSQSGE